MTEVHVLDGYLAGLPIDSSRQIVDTLYKQLFEKYGLDSMSFSANLDYYYSDPVLTEKIYEKIQKDLTEREKEMIRVDSIRAAVQSDSMARINRYQNLLSMQQSLLRVYHKPDSVLNISEYNNGLYRGSGLSYLWQGWHRIPPRSSSSGSRSLRSRLPVLIRRPDELALDSLPFYERYRDALYQDVGLPNFWKEKSPVDDTADSIAAPGPGVVSAIQGGGMGEEIQEAKEATP